MSLARTSSQTPSLRVSPGIPTSNHLADPSGQNGFEHAGIQTFAGVKSTDLLRGQKAVDIQHNGLTYRLQATRLGKLILTK